MTSCLKDSLDAEQLLHGFRVRLPLSWQDHTLYKFVAPSDARASVHVGAKTPLRFLSNVVVNKIETTKDREMDLDQMLRFRSEDNARRYRAHRVLGSGKATYLGQDVTWQDMTFVDPATQLQIFQRDIAFKTGPHEAALLTLSSDKPELEMLSDAIDFDIDR